MKFLFHLTDKLMVCLSLCNTLFHSFTLLAILSIQNFNKQVLYCQKIWDVSLIFLFYPFDQVFSFHTARESSFTLCFSGTSSIVISIYASFMFSSSFSNVSPCVIISGCSRSFPTQNFSPFQ